MILTNSNRTNEIKIKIPAAKAAASNASDSTKSTMRTGTVLDEPITIVVAPVSLKLRVNVKIAELKIPRFIIGNITLRKLVSSLAPNVRAAS